MMGDNSESDKKDWFKKEFGGEVSEYYGDRLDFYKKIMNPKVEVSLPLVRSHIGSI
jgi:hypothetical protein